MEDLFLQLAYNHNYIVFLVILISSIIEGPIISMIVGVMIKMGIVGFWQSYIFIMLGDIIADVGWYWVGRSYGHRFIARFGKYVGVNELKVEKLTHIFHKHKHPILFISKISNGFGFSLVTLITAGLVKIPFYKYFLVNLAGQIVWSAALVSIGYYFSDYYSRVDSVLGKLGIFAVLVLMIYSFIGYKRYLKSKIEQT
jgi:membrane protein DedA with SNARE-associated domain